MAAARHLKSLLKQPHLLWHISSQQYGGSSVDTSVSIMLSQTHFYLTYYYLVYSHLEFLEHIQMGGIQEKTNHLGWLILTWPVCFISSSSVWTHLILMAITEEDPGCRRLQIHYKSTNLHFLHKGPVQHLHYRDVPQQQPNLDTSRLLETSTTPKIPTVIMKMALRHFYGVLV